MKFLHIGEFLYSTRMLALHIVFVRKKAVIKDRLGSALALSADISVRYLKTAFNALERIPVLMLMEALETAYSAFSIVPVMHTCFIAIDAESFDEAVLAGMSASRTESALILRMLTDLTTDSTFRILPFMPAGNSAFCAMTVLPRFMRAYQAARSAYAIFKRLMCAQALANPCNGMEKPDPNAACQQEDCGNRNDNDLSALQYNSSLYHSFVNATFPASVLGS